MPRLARVRPLPSLPLPLYQIPSNKSLDINFPLFFICSLNQNIQLAFEKLQHDYDKLRKEETDRSARLQELMYVDAASFMLGPLGLGHSLSFLSFAAVLARNKN